MKYSDGAPEWATLTDGKPHIAEGAVWSDAYFTSQAVHAAFDNFYANKPGPGGVGLQDRYAQAWRFLAEHYANNATVIGYDLMNEPFAGKSGSAGHIDALGKACRGVRRRGRFDGLGRNRDYVPVEFTRGSREHPQ